MGKWGAVIVIAVCFHGKANASSPLQEPVPETGYNHLEVNVTGPEVVQRGQQVKITITLLNKTSSLIGIGVALGRAELNDEILVRGPCGPLNSKPAENLITTNLVDAVAPGGQWEEASVISDIYDMRMPGIYSIRARRHLRDGSILESNQLTVTVVK
jgi:hypothetical protein